MTSEQPGRERISDEQAAMLRQARFGTLPHRAMPDERIELIEIDARRDLPEPEPWSVSVPQG